MDACGAVIRVQQHSSELRVFMSALKPLLVSLSLVSITSNTNRFNSGTLGNIWFLFKNICDGNREGDHGTIICKLLCSNMLNWI